MAVSLDALPPYLSNRNHPNTRFVPPVIFFGFEISGIEQHKKAIFLNLGGLQTHIVCGLDGNTVEITILDHNVRRLGPYSQENIDKTAKALGYPPKVYVSIEYPWWGIRRHYHYDCESFMAPFLLDTDRVSKTERSSYACLASLYRTDIHIL